MRRTPWRDLVIVVVLAVLITALLMPWARRVLGPRIEQAKRMHQL